MVWDENRQLRAKPNPNSNPKLISFSIPFPFPFPLTRHHSIHHIVVSRITHPHLSIQLVDGVFLSVSQMDAFLVRKRPFEAHEKEFDLRTTKKGKLNQSTTVTSHNTSLQTITSARKSSATWASSSLSSSSFSSSSSVSPSLSPSLSSPFSRSSSRYQAEFHPLTQPMRHTHTHTKQLTIEQMKKVTVSKEGEGISTKAHTS